MQSRWWVSLQLGQMSGRMRGKAWSICWFRVCGNSSIAVLFPRIQLFAVIDYDPLSTCVTVRSDIRISSIVKHFPQQWKIGLYTQLPCSRDGTSWRAPWRFVKLLPSSILIMFLRGWGLEERNSQHPSKRLHKLTQEMTHRNPRGTPQTFKGIAHDIRWQVNHSGMPKWPVRRRFLHIVPLFHEVLAQAEAKLSCPISIPSNWAKLLKSRIWTPEGSQSLKELGGKARPFFEMRDPTDVHGILMKRHYIRRAMERLWRGIWHSIWIYNYTSWGPRVIS